MLFRSDHDDWKKEDFVQYVEHILETFGKDRVMFGSDWPVCLLAGSYDEVVEVLQHALPDKMSESDTDKLFGANAHEFYKL